MEKGFPLPVDCMYLRYCSNVLPRIRKSHAAAIVPHTKVRAQNIKGSSEEGRHSHWSKSKASWNRISTANQTKQKVKTDAACTTTHTKVKPINWSFGKGNGYTAALILSRTALILNRE